MVQMCALYSLTVPWSTAAICRHVTAAALILLAVCVLPSHHIRRGLPQECPKSCISMVIWCERGLSGSSFKCILYTTRLNATNSTLNNPTAISLPSSAMQCYDNLKNVTAENDEKYKSDMDRAESHLNGLTKYSALLANAIKNETDPVTRKQNAEEFEKYILNVAADIFSQISQKSEDNQSQLEMEVSLLTRMLAEFDEVGATLAYQLSEGTTKTTKSNHTELVLANFKPGETINITGSNNNVTFDLQPSPGETSVCVALSQVTRTAGNLITRLHYQSTTSDSGSSELASDILVVSVTQGAKLKQNVTLSFQQLNYSAGRKPVCVTLASSSDKLDNVGCTLTKMGPEVQCSCNHLSSFAIIMTITEEGSQQASSRFEQKMLSYVCLTLSLICLILSFLTFVSFRALQSDRNLIHANLSGSLIVAQLIFLVGVDQTDNKTTCAVIAGLLHFSFLAAFTWMANEGLNVYMTLVVVLERQHFIVPIYYGIGYGLPAIIVAISAAVYSQGYGTEQACWLSHERGFIFSFVGPAIFVIIVDCVMLAIAVRLMMRHSLSSKKDCSQRQRCTKWIKGAVALLSVMGVTWAFGIFAMGGQSTEVFAYIFIILCGSQGVFIFLFHCMSNEKVKKEYRWMIRSMTWFPLPIRRCCFGLVASGSKSKLEASTAGGDLQGTLSEFQSRDEARGYMAETDYHSKPLMLVSRDAVIRSAGNKRYSGFETIEMAPEGLVAETIAAGVYLGDDTGGVYGCSETASVVSDRENWRLSWLMRSPETEISNKSDSIGRSTDPEEEEMIGKSADPEPPARLLEMSEDSKPPARLLEMPEDSESRLEEGMSLSSRNISDTNLLTILPKPSIISQSSFVSQHFISQSSPSPDTDLTTPDDN